MAGPKLFWIDSDDRLTPIEGEADRYHLLPGRELNQHLTKSLRAKIGDSFLFCRPEDHTHFSGHIISLSPLTVDLKQDHSIIRAAPATLLGIALAPFKGDGFTSLLGQAIMSGMHRIRPLSTDRSVVDWGNSSRWEGKSSRFRTLIREKSQLAGRTDRMILEPPLSISRFLDLPPGESVIWFDEDQAGTLDLKSLLGIFQVPSGFSRSVSCMWGMVGPEGGWSDAERQLAQKMEVQGRLIRVSLGELTYSAEAAAIAVVSLFGLVLSSFLETQNKTSSF
ncbi:MAG: RsmE family RNA methyltransferase [Leptospirales bacterium]